MKVEGSNGKITVNGVIVGEFTNFSMSISPGRPMSPLERLREWIFGGVRGSVTTTDLNTGKILGQDVPILYYPVWTRLLRKLGIGKK